MCILSKVPCPIAFATATFHHCSPNVADGADTVQKIVGRLTQIRMSTLLGSGVSRLMGWNIPRAYSRQKYRYPAMLSALIEYWSEVLFCMSSNSVNGVRDDSTPSPPGFTTNKNYLFCTCIQCGIINGPRSTDLILSRPSPVSSGIVTVFQQTGVGWYHAVQRLHLAPVGIAVVFCTT